MSLSAFLAVVLLHLMVAVSPGPAVLMAARTGVTEGFRTGAMLAAGIGTAAVVWAASALFGLSLLFQFAPALLIGFKIAGAVILLYLAVKLWRHADDPLEQGQSSAPRSLRSAFWLGFVTQISNPKPAILFAAIFVGTVPETATWPVYGALLAAVFLNETVWNTLVARIFSLPALRRTYLGLKGTIDRLFGGILAVLGIKIAST